MDNAYNQSMVAYANSPKEANNKRSMSGPNQFGSGDRMPQDKNVVKKQKTEHGLSNRHKEHR